MNIKSFFLASAVVFSGAGVLFAGPGTTGGQILEINTSAYAASLGDAFAGAANNLSAALYNPAGLSQMSGAEFEFSHMLYFLGTSLSSFGYGQGIGSVGLGVNVKQFRAKDKVRDISGKIIEEFSIDYGQYTLAAGFSADDRHSLGAAVNFLTESIYGEGGSAISFDLGWHGAPSPNNTYGAVLRNIGQRIKVYETEVKLPFQGAIAGAHSGGVFDFLWEVSRSSQYKLGVKCGVQAHISKEFRFRSGLVYINRPDFTVGFGVSLEQWVLDYAFSPHSDLGISHRFSLGARL